MGLCVSVRRHVRVTSPSVHRAHIEVVDDRRLLALGVVAELAEAGCDLFLDLVVVGDLGEGDAALVLDRVLQSLVEAVEEAL